MIKENKECIDQLFDKEYEEDYQRLKTLVTDKYDLNSLKRLLREYFKLGYNQAMVETENFTKYVY